MLQSKKGSKVVANMVATIIKNCDQHLYIELLPYKNIKIVNMKLIYIRSTMEPKNYSTIRSILKKEQGETIASYIFKINNTQTLEAYLRKERITYEIYQEEKKIINIRKRKQDENMPLQNKRLKPLDKMK